MIDNSRLSNLTSRLEGRQFLILFFFKTNPSTLHNNNNKCDRRKVNIRRLPVYISHFVVAGNACARYVLIWCKIFTIVFDIIYSVFFSFFLILWSSVRYYIATTHKRPREKRSRAHNLKTGFLSEDLTHSQQNEWGLLWGVSVYLGARMTSEYVHICMYLYEYSCQCSEASILEVSCTWVGDDDENRISKKNHLGRI